MLGTPTPFCTLLVVMYDSSRPCCLNAEFAQFFLIIFGSSKQHDFQGSDNAAVVLSVLCKATLMSKGDADVFRSQSRCGHKFRCPVVVICMQHMLHSVYALQARNDCVRAN